MNIYMNSPEFEHDVQMLIMAFFPGRELKVIVSDDCYFDNRIDNKCISDNKDNEDNKEFVSFYIGNVISFEVFENGISKAYMQEPITLTDRKLRKDQIKRLVYKVLSEHLNIELPWGTLTGIRPVKMVRQELEDGISDDELISSLKRDYYMSDDKINLSIDVAKTELDALRDVPYKGGYSLYIGIPFCPSRCAYCSFTSYSLSIYESRVDEYLDRLCEEIDYTINLFGRERINTVYVGGGTPTTLSPEQLDKLLSCIRNKTKESKVHELTVEAGRPDSITEEKLTVLLNYAVDRISINPQTMNDDTLKTIGRKHTVKQTVDAFKLARKMGFDNINMDIIVGLPGEEKEDIENTLKAVKALGPDSLTVHSLAIKRAARLNTQKGLFTDYKSINSSEIMKMTADYAASMGMKPYYLYRQKNMTGNFENVGYSVKGKAALYNILIMEEMQTIAACGAGASSKLYIPSENRIERVENVKDVGVYLERFDDMINRKKNAVEKEEGRLFNAY